MLRKKDGILERIHGENRIRALKLNGSKQVPAIILENVSDAKETLAEIKRIPTLLHETQNLRNLNCKVMNPFPQKSCVQEAPSLKYFLVPYIMDFQRSQNQDLILMIDNIADELN